MRKPFWGKPPCCRRSNLRARSKKATAEKNGWWLSFCMVGGLLFLLILLMVLDQISWGKPPHCTARADSPSATCAEESRRWLLRSAAEGRLLPSSRRASLRATLPGAACQSFFWWALNFSWTFSLRSELVVKCNISIFDFFVSVSLWLWWLLKWHAPTKLLSDPSSLRPKHNNLKM